MSFESQRIAKLFGNVVQKAKKLTSQKLHKAPKILGSYLTSKFDPFQWITELRLVNKNRGRKDRRKASQNSL